MNIKVLSFQSTEVGEGDITDNSVGGLNHFEILVFKNSAIIGGVPFERILLDDVPKNDKLYFGQNEQARFKILDDFILGLHSSNSLEKHQESIEILSNMYKLMSKRFNTEFRYAVEILIEHHNKFLICKRQSHLKIAPNIWNVPAGKVKENEGIEEALLREVKEETNLDISNVEYIDYHFINKKHKRIVFTYYTKVEKIENFILDKTEFSESKWISAEEVDEITSLPDYLKFHIKKLGGLL
ncbi:NUDIX hydrolase [Granulicatella sp. 19428wC4_WM01]|uniref:NUDIX hydrolase n=1 Tax=Granulicatella sp. 19428wC4_WM01 TaxID=2782471 RepID=UPI0018831EA4|nr:NUDIX hydrolase [Granulicatella sp. 19428wC4_WM01]MBF0780526.1 NUDIX hydrolase [Granulicatella sp. 19428wC4_WM01]